MIRRLICSPRYRTFQSFVFAQKIKLNLTYFIQLRYFIVIALKYERYYAYIYHLFAYIYIYILVEFLKIFYLFISFIAHKFVASLSFATLFPLFVDTINFFVKACFISGNQSVKGDSNRMVHLTFVTNEIYFSMKCSQSKQDLFSFIF